MRAWLALVLFLGGCGVEVTPAETTPVEGTWPKRVTLVTQLAANQSDGVRLADGVIVAGGGDLSLYQGKVLSISSPVADSVCEKGMFDALGDIPTTVDACPAALSGMWEKFAYLSAASIHTSEESYVTGHGLLVRSADHTAMYRLRMVGDSYDAEGESTATFDYEPVP